MVWTHHGRSASIFYVDYPDSSNIPFEVKVRQWSVNLKLTKNSVEEG